MRERERERKREKEGGKEREKQKTLIWCSTYLYIHWLLLVCALTRGWTHNCDALEWCSNQLSHLPGYILSLYWGLIRVQSHTQSRWPHHHISISSLCPWAVSRKGKTSEMHIPSTGMGQGPSKAAFQFVGQGGGCVFLMTIPIPVIIILSWAIVANISNIYWTQFLQIKLYNYQWFTVLIHL